MTKKLEYILDCLDAQKEKIKEQSLVYQFQEKSRIAKALNIPFESVDLPYPDWKLIRDNFKN